MCQNPDGGITVGMDCAGPRATRARARTAQAKQVQVRKTWTPKGPKENERETRNGPFSLLLFCVFDLDGGLEYGPTPVFFPIPVTISLLAINKDRSFGGWSCIVLTVRYGITVRTAPRPHFLKRTSVWEIVCCPNCDLISSISSCTKHPAEGIVQASASERDGEREAGETRLGLVYAACVQSRCELCEYSKRRPWQEPKPSKANKARHPPRGHAAVRDPPPRPSRTVAACSVVTTLLHGYWHHTTNTCVQPAPRCPPDTRPCLT
ncbi:hypothetical protein BC826DRAFT_966876 [Russula brevipes]|nr:hypothetical protein BC826DRAFT_966876 [Russula brevipes]